MGVHTDNAERKWQEERQDELIKIRCIELVMQYASENHKNLPWKQAQRYYLWVKYNNPDMEVL